MTVPRGCDIVYIGVPPVVGVVGVGVCATGAWNGVKLLYWGPPPPCRRGSRGGWLCHGCVHCYIGSLPPPPYRRGSRRGWLRHGGMTLRYCVKIHCGHGALAGNGDKRLKKVDVNARIFYIEISDRSSNLTFSTSCHLSPASAP